MKKQIISLILATFLTAMEITLPVHASPLNIAAEPAETSRTTEPESTEEIQPSTDESVSATDSPDSELQDELSEQKEIPLYELEAEVQNEETDDTEDSKTEETLSTPDTSNKVSASRASYKAGGDCGNDLKWSLDYNGNLYIYGEGEMTHYGFWDYTTPGWKDFAEEIKTLTIEQGATTIGRSAFSGCPNLKTVKLPDTMVIIDSDAFNNCTALASINLPKSLKELGSSTFSGCTSLTSITLPSGLENLGDRGYGLSTFSHTGLKKITIPSSVKKMAAYCFKGCQNLTEAVISGTNLTIPYQSFIDCTNLKTVNLNKGIVVLENETFRNCTSLTSINLGSELTFIGGAAFEGCTALKEISIPDKVTELQSINYSYVFEGCTSLQKVTFGAGLNKIGNYSFKNCTSLQEIRFCGAAPTFSGNNTFEGCGNITGYYPKNSKTWDRSVLTAHGATRIDWKTWTPPLSHFTPVLKSIINTGKGVKLTWDKLSGAKGYIIYRKTGNGNWSQVKSISNGSTKTWTDKSVANGKRYTWRICGINGSIKSKVSNSEFLYYLTKTSLTVSSKSGILTAKWKKNKKATGYQIQYSNKKNFSRSGYSYANKAKTVKKSISLRRGKTYYVRVRPFKTVNGKTFYGSWSSKKKNKIK